MKHDQCDHPRTPAGRAACRKANGYVPNSMSSTEVARLSAFHRAAADGPKGHVRVPRDQRTRTLAKEYDLADVPHAFAGTIRWAWKAGLVVRTGHPYNDDERRILITGATGELGLVWRSKLPHGVTAVMWRVGSVTSKLSTVNAGVARLNGEKS